MGKSQTTLTNGPQKTPFIKYCPNCKGDLTPTESRKQSAETSSKYKCDVCRRVFEIGELPTTNKYFFRK